jgi:DNA-binding transcriptional MerR regulator
MLTLTELSQEVGCHTETCRYYERLGILRPSVISGAETRYDQSHTRQLQFILRLRNLGFTLEQTADLVNLLWTEDSSFTDTISSLNKHLLLADHKIQSLQKLHESLTTVVKKCREKNTVDSESKSHVIDRLTAN